MFESSAVVPLLQKVFATEFVDEVLFGVRVA